MRTFVKLAFPALAAMALVSCARNRLSDRAANFPLPASGQMLGVPAIATPVPPEGGTPNLAGAGRQLFLKNCAHCHGPDAHGDEGPDLYSLDWTGEQIAARIRNGKKGQMTAFAGKLSPEDIQAVIAYLGTLK